MMQLPLYIDAAFADRADVHGLPDFAETPSHRPKGGHGFALDWQDANRRAMAELARAVKEGRHIPGPEGRRGRFVCTFGNHACDGIVFSAVGGGGGVAGTKHYCQACFDKHRPDGVEADLDALGITTRFVRAKERPKPPRMTLAEYLVLWAARNFPEAALAYYDRGDWEWRARVMAAIIRRRASADSNWVVRLATSRFWGEFYDVSATVVQAGGYPIDPQRMTLGQWIINNRQLRGLSID
jgi:hypothetical protein